MLSASEICISSGDNFVARLLNSIFFFGRVSHQSDSINFNFNHIVTHHTIHSINQFNHWEVWTRKRCVRVCDTLLTNFLRTLTHAQQQQKTHGHHIRIIRTIHSIRILFDSVHQMILSCYTLWLLIQQYCFDYLWITVSPVRKSIAMSPRSQTIVWQRERLSHKLFSIFRVCAPVTPAAMAIEKTQLQLPLTRNNCAKHRWVNHRFRFIRLE